MDEMTQSSPVVEETTQEVNPSEEVIEKKEVSGEPSGAERNFAELREQKKRVERERDELRQRMATVEAAQKQQQEQQHSTSLADDDLVEWKHVKKEIGSLKKQIEGYQQQSTAANAETMIRNKFPDFEAVVNNQNIERLREKHPEIAQALASNNDLYTKASATYEIIKKYGIYQEDIYQKDKQLAQQNASKHRPLSSIAPQQGDTPLDRANAFSEGLTDDLKKRLYKEMQQAIKLR